MKKDLQEQACWLLLTFESRLSTRIVNDILVTWCKQLGRTLEEFFAASSQEWITTCHLKPEFILKLEQAKEKLVGQAFLKVVTGLSQVVIVAESDTKGGTWEGANGALKQGRSLYVRQTLSSPMLGGNEALIKLGGLALPWPAENMAEVFSSLLFESAVLQQKQSEKSERSEQPTLFAAPDG